MTEIVYKAEGAQGVGSTRLIRQMGQLRTMNSPGGKAPVWNLIDT
jgi:hypothetical protein